MSDLLTIEQAICSRTNGHCATCRDRESGRTWRAELASAIVLPAGATDFTCPLGHPWGHVPTAVTAYVSGLITQRLAICRQCDDWNGNLCEQQFPRGKCLRGCTKWLLDSASTCPTGRW